MKLTRTPSWIIDSLGAVVVLGTLAAAGWLGVVQTVKARTLQGDQQGRIAAARTTLTAFNEQRGPLQRALADHQRALSDLGAGRPSIEAEAYLQSLAALAPKHEVRVIQHRQLGERLYPGIRERRFSFHLKGTTVGLWSLLREIEQKEAWADVSYLKLEGGPGDAAERMAALTISIFSERDLQSAATAAGRRDD